MTKLPPNLSEIASKCAALLPLWRDISSVWTMPVIHILGAVDRIRFNELKRLIHGISATGLAERLRTFERLGMLERAVYAEIPPRVEYSLTDRGRELHSTLADLRELATKWVKEEPELLREPVVATVKG